MTGPWATGGTRLLEAQLADWAALGFSSLPHSLVPEKERKKRKERKERKIKREEKGLRQRGIFQTHKTELDLGK